MTAEVALAAAAAMAVALGGPSESSELAAVTAIARMAASRHGLPSARLQSAAQAALLAAPHHEPALWPSVFARVAGSVSLVGLQDEFAMQSVITMFEGMRLAASELSASALASSVDSATVISSSAMSSVASNTGQYGLAINLARAGNISVTYSQDGSSILVSGAQTFHIRENLKGLGGMFFDKEKIWRFPNTRNSTASLNLLLGRSFTANNQLSAGASIGAASDAPSQPARLAPLDFSAGDAEFVLPPPILVKHAVKDEDTNKYRFLLFPSQEERLKGTYPRFLMWHGLVDGWPPMRHINIAGQTTWATTAMHSKIKKVMEYVDARINLHALAFNERPSHAYLVLACKLCVDLESLHGGFNPLYEILSQKENPTAVRSFPVMRSDGALPLAGNKRGAQDRT